MEQLPGVFEDHRQLPFGQPSNGRWSSLEISAADLIHILCTAVVRACLINGIGQHSVGIVPGNPSTRTTYVWLCRYDHD